MSIEAWRWWRVTEGGKLRSLYLDAVWETPVLTAECPVLEMYHVKITEPDSHKGITGISYATGEVIEKPHVWGKERVLIMRPPEVVIGQIIELPCASGIHALRTLTERVPAILGWFGSSEPTFVSGAVRLFGHIVEHERGWRAEKALVSGPLTLYKQDAELAQQLAMRYDCEVTCTTESPYGPGKDDPGV
jgi:hypothetical protein